MTVLLNELLWLGGWTSLYARMWDLSSTCFGSGIFLKTKKIILLTDRRSEWNFFREGTLFSGKCHSSYSDIYHCISFTKCIPLDILENFV